MVKRKKGRQNDALQNNCRGKYLIEFESLDEEGKGREAKIRAVLNCQSLNRYFYVLTILADSSNRHNVDKFHFTIVQVHLVSRWLNLTECSVFV